MDAKLLIGDERSRARNECHRPVDCMQILWNAHGLACLRDLPGKSPTQQWAAATAKVAEDNIKSTASSHTMDEAEQERRKVWGPLLA